MNKHIPGLCKVTRSNAVNHPANSIQTLFSLLTFPALKGFNPKSATFRQHYYPEGGWGWVITFCAILVQILTTGLQFSYGILYIHILGVFGPENVMSTGNY